MARVEVRAEGAGPQHPDVQGTRTSMVVTYEVTQRVSSRSREQTHVPGLPGPRSSHRPVLFIMQQGTTSQGLAGKASLMCWVPVGQGGAGSIIMQTITAAAAPEAFPGKACPPTPPHRAPEVARLGSWAPLVSCGPQARELPRTSLSSSLYLG